MSDTRDRALRAAQEQAEQRQRAANEAAEHQRQYEEQLVAHAESLCAETLGVTAKFAMREVNIGNSWEPAWERRARAEIEGVTVTLLPPLGGHNPLPWRLSHNLADLGNAIQARENEIREAAERATREAALRQARTCDWCGRESTENFGPVSPAEQVALHKKKWCSNVPWWRRIGRQGDLGTG
jgi:hypothetical protein